MIHLNSQIIFFTSCFMLTNQEKGGESMFNLPLETVLLMLPWPFIWVTLALVMYFKLRRDEKRENHNE